MEQPDGIVGTIVSIGGLWSPQLDNVRPIYVHLPWGYDEGETRYPVLYMHDGQNLFSPHLSFSGDWRVDETLERLRGRGLHTIVVGIPNQGVQRLDEYSPFVAPGLGGGKGDAYLDFIVETLKPQIDAIFRTLPRREHTGILGSSMGGLISLYAFFRRPDVFGFCGAMSPALWFAERAIFPFAAAAPFAEGRIYLDVGADEHPAMVSDAKRMRELLATKGYHSGRDLLFLEEPGAPHSEAAWAGRLSDALRLFLEA